MPTVFTHGIVAITLSKMSRLKKGKGWLLVLLAIFCAVIPDADVIAFNFGIPYEHPFGHRGFTHSIFFSVLLGGIIAFLFYRKTATTWAYWLFFSVVTLSHAVFDAMTSGGLGCAFFFPIDNSRFFFPFRPITVSPLGVKNFFSEWGWRTMQSEFYWVWIPCFFILIILWIIGRRK
ncbi:MAG: metal-dependent hydrolase [Chitinophagales bacterium]